MDWTWDRNVFRYVRNWCNLFSALTCSQAKLNSFGSYRYRLKKRLRWLSTVFSRNVQIILLTWSNAYHYKYYNSYIQDIKKWPYHLSNHILVSICSLFNGYLDNVYSRQGKLYRNEKMVSYEIDNVCFDFYVWIIFGTFIFLRVRDRIIYHSTIMGYW